VITRNRSVITCSSTFGSKSCRYRTRSKSPRTFKTIDASEACLMLGDKHFMEEDKLDTETLAKVRKPLSGGMR
jgi:hypothetical protein